MANAFNRLASHLILYIVAEFCDSLECARVANCNQHLRNLCTLKLCCERPPNISRALVRLKSIRMVKLLSAQTLTTLFSRAVSARHVTWRPKQSYRKPLLWIGSLSPDDVVKLLSNAWSDIRQLCVDYCGNGAAYLVPLVLHVMSTRLERLSLSHTSVTTRTHETAACIAQQVSRLPWPELQTFEWNLASLDCRIMDSVLERMPRLSSLRLGCTMSVPVTLLDHCPHLTELVMMDACGQNKTMRLHHFKQLRRLHLEHHDERDAIDLAKLPLSLEVLTCKGLHFDCHGHHGDLVVFPNLRELWLENFSLKKTTMWRTNLLFLVAQRFPHLVSLTLVPPCFASSCIDVCLATLGDCNSRHLLPRLQWFCIKTWDKNKYSTAHVQTVRPLLRIKML